jgi:hypothetical protein
VTDEEAGLRRAGHRLVLNRDRMDLEDAEECMPWTPAASFICTRNSSMTA